MARVEIFLHLKTTPDGVCVCRLERQQIWDATRIFEGRDVDAQATRRRGVLKIGSIPGSCFYDLSEYQNVNEL
ncbi:hypothetical protein NOF04DRAFT_4292 [Fusarium oxysporum II5]|uniref:Uncharacterized protein n=1 Tax=Fusarium odoratissimum (strain NRRL 54006) TaxID=1089451 RepID=X0JU71_FUSO5|nr:uncharacterized protein FOIG_08000 [Fusarium odoratissimum NRRL 54006]EXL99855.1 hypothetical protein FOIG_08000 [Fusarium odoratissimum NRRL 54006]KAK2135672.1 hypothetical protein NOF04DRAFT_4292 [Fusarium oxysporum II5]